MTSSSLTGTWYESPGNSLNIGNTFGTIYVSKGATSGVIFNGQMGDNTYFGNCSFTTVPEPLTIVLLGCGLFGLLAYAWRKRK